MKTIYSIIYTSILSVFIVGLFFSNAMLSISTVMLFVFAIIAQLTSTNKNKFTLLQFAFLLLFIIYVCWSFYLCSNVEYFIASIVSKLSLLGMALFLPQININKKQKFCLLALMLLIIIGISFYTIIIYFNEISFWKNAYSTGLVLPTFMHHSKYSFLIAISILVLLYSIHHSKKYRNIKIVLALYLIIYLHFLAVKTGLICFYIAIFFYILYQVIQKKWYYIILFIIPFLLYNYSPNLQNKINYLKYDIQQLNTPDNNLYSDARRIVSYQIAIDIFKKNKILGVGITNYKTKTQEKYIEKLHFFDADKMKYVHNSYLHILASCGILGLIFFMISIICIYLYYIKERNYITLAMISLYFLVCFWDAYTEQLVGMSILYLIVILGNQKNKN